MTDEFANVQRMFNRLPDAIQGKIVKRALRAGANIIVKDAKSRVPVKSGLLRKSIKSKLARKRDLAKGEHSIYVFPNKALKFSKKVTVGGQSARMNVKTRVFYRHFVEFGTTNSDGTVRMKAKPYMTPAIAATKHQVEQTFERTILDDIAKEVAK